MIVLEILFWFLIGLLALILLVLVTPVSAFLSMQDKFSVKVFVWGIPVFSSARKKSKKPISAVKQRKKEEHALKKKVKKAHKPKKENIWQRSTEKYGFADSVKGFGNLAMSVLNKAVRVLRHIHFRKLKFQLNVASSDAAQTAIHYGIVCSVVYPLFERLISISDCKAKKIDINADFNHPKSSIQFSVAVRTQPIWFLILGLSALRVYKKWERDFLE
ncbi:MAG: DUF2953 domain-containing protein [Clostridia bacterium]|nr:DUF2953 domain-containing protein [Clostridia bacterium]